MKKTLLLYSGQDGQTLKIMHFIQSQLTATHHCELRNLHQTKKIDATEYDLVIIGAAVRYGGLNKKLYQFIQQNVETLNATSNGFFCVNLTARKAGKDTPESSVYMKKFLKRSIWLPQKQAVFAGALKYPQYNMFDRTMIRFIMKITGGETDPTKEVEYTDWQKVAEFADEVARI